MDRKNCEVCLSAKLCYDIKIDYTPFASYEWGVLFDQDSTEGFGASLTMRTVRIATISGVSNWLQEASTT